MYVARVQKHGTLQYVHRQFAADIVYKVSQSGVGQLTEMVGAGRARGTNLAGGKGISAIGRVC